METNLPPQIAMTQMILGYVNAKAVHVAAKLNIADLLAKHGPMDSSELANRTDADGESIFRLLRALASNGIFKEGENGKFSLTPMAECLKEDSPNSTKAMALCAGSLFYKTYNEFLFAVQNGGGGWVKALGAAPFEYLQNHPEEGKIFDRMMTDIHGGETQPMVENYDFSVFKTVVDVGGGNGEVISAVLHKNPGTKGILFDLPEVIERSKENIVAAGLSDRCQLASGNFFESVPKNGDTYILRHIVHDWKDTDAVAILTNCRKAMNPGGKVLVVEAVIPEGNDPHPFKWLDLTMLMIDGKERNSKQFEDIFSQAGLKLTRIVAATPFVNVVEGVAKS